MNRHYVNPPMKAGNRAVAQVAERRSPKPLAGGSSPSCPAFIRQNPDKNISGLYMIFIIR